MLVGQRVDFLDVLPGERSLGTVGHGYAAGAERWVFPVAECEVEHVASVDILDVRRPDTCAADPLRTLHAAEGVADELPVHHIGGFVNRQINAVFVAAGAVLGAVGVEVAAALAVVEYGRVGAVVADYGILIFGIYILVVFLFRFDRPFVDHFLPAACKEQGCKGYKQIFVYCFHIIGISRSNPGSG